MIIEDGRGLDDNVSCARGSALSRSPLSEHALREVSRPPPLVAGFVRDACRTRSELLTENALLRQQPIVASRQVRRPACGPYECGMIVALSSRLEHWQSALVLVKPETVLRWHREGFRLFWKHRSKSAKRPQPRVPQETIALIRQMPRDNRL